ncbi:MAG: 16S rRNA (cytidine(1402)-2'-O)-methyltransferase [Gemmatimonadota bacterium]|nr:16S rRNA (cytidine(1402)-2'-O)-methyltransferase [Gemmatimonadota bacterium]
MSEQTSDGTGGSLYVVSTPIGNLGDLTQRGVQTLRDVATILAEDTRHSRHLLDHYAIETRLEAYHEHNEARMTPRLLARLVGGESMALISDAGTPLLSDPGARLVRAATEAGIRIIPVPGASALLAALVASGLDGDRFTFFGFLARKGADRTRALEELAALPHTAVLYEAPSRVAATLQEIASVGGEARRAVVARELTKQYEEIRRGTVGDLARYYASIPPRGEIVILLEGVVAAPIDEQALRETARRLKAEGATARDIARQLAAEHGAPRNVAYRIAHE